MTSEEGHLDRPWTQRWTSGPPARAVRCRGVGKLRYSINVTLDGCCDHRAIPANEALHHHHAANLEKAGALLLGRVTYEMMESAWRLPLTPGTPGWMEPFARTIDAAKKYVVSSTVGHVDWNAELLEGDLGDAVRQLKASVGGEVLTGGMQLPLALAQLDLIDEYELVVHPRLVGHGPTLLDGLSQHIDLDLVDQQPLGAGVMVVRYAPQR